MENLPKLTKSQIIELDAQIKTAQLNGRNTVAFPAVISGVAGLVAAGITAVLVAQDLGGRSIPNNMDTTSDKDLSDFLNEFQENGKYEDISLSKLIELRKQL